MYARALMLSLQSLSERRILAVLFKSLAVTAIAFAALGIGIWFGIRWILARYVQDSGDIAAVIAFAGMLIAGWVLWRVVAIAAIWFFSDDIVDAVELRHYPARAQTGRRPDMLQSARMALQSAARAAGYNLLASPVYIILLVTGIGTPIAFILVNSALLGRDLKDMLTVRHGTEFGTLTKRSWLLIGLLGTAAMLLPFINILVPVVACAMAVHMVHMKQN
jgi:CysZ protein